MIISAYTPVKRTSPLARGHQPPATFERTAIQWEVSARDMARLREGIPVVKLDGVIEESAGGCNSRASVARIGGKKFFLKGNAGSIWGSRYANWESDLITRQLAQRLKLRCPKMELLRLEAKEPLRERLGDTVLSMQFVDSDFVSGKVRGGGYLEGKSNVDAFLKMFLLDCLIGNADRRNANYFIVEKAGGWEPILIDNNAGFGTGLLWKSPTNHCNFIKSFDGLGSGEVLKDMGTIQGMIMDTWDYPNLLDSTANRKRALELARQLPQLLDDAFIDQIVAGVPREVMPSDCQVEAPSEALRQAVSEENLKLLYSGAEPPLSGDELWAARQQELTSTLKWRRDHLAEALQNYFKTEARRATT